MNRFQALRSGAVGVGLLLLAGSALAAPVTPPRAGQVGVGVQGQFGSLLQRNDFAHDFGTGPGLAVRLRYRMRFDRGLGLSFESHTADARGRVVQPKGFPTQPDSIGFDKLSIITAGLDAYKMWGTRTRNTLMASAGAGVAQFTARANDGETVYPLNGDGFYMSAGLGVERFFYRAWAFDVSGRYFALFHEGQVIHDTQVSAGLIFYASY